MAKQFEQIEPSHAAFIADRHIFLTASTALAGRANISPRGADASRVPTPNSVADPGETDSGSETAAHIRLPPRLTTMCCDFPGAVHSLDGFKTGVLAEDAVAAE